MLHSIACTSNGCNDVIHHLQVLCSMLERTIQHIDPSKSPSYVGNYTRTMDHLKKYLKEK